MSINQIYFIDIETVPQYGGNDVPDTYQANVKFENEHFNLFKKKFPDALVPLGPGGSTWLFRDAYMNNAGLYAEFGKIVCVSIGKMHSVTPEGGGKPENKFFIKTIASRDEKDVLIQIAEALEKATILCAHNGKGFDFPFLFRRYVINGIPVPELLQVAGKKPWEIPHLDTMEIWSHLEWRYRCSLNLLASVLGLESPKQDMDGSMVAEIYNGEDQEAGLKRIADYCASDMTTLANVYCRLKGYPLITEDQIKFV